MCEWSHTAFSSMLQWFDSLIELLLYKKLFNIWPIIFHIWLMYSLKTSPNLAAFMSARTQVKGVYNTCARVGRSHQFLFPMVISSLMSERRRSPRMSVTQHHLCFSFAFLSANWIRLYELTAGDKRHCLLCLSLCVFISHPRLAVCIRKISYVCKSIQLL